VVGREREGEQKIAEAVRPGEEFLGLRLCPIQSNELPFRPAGHGPGDVERRGGGSSGRENERRERRVQGVEPVDVMLQSFDVAPRDPMLRAGSSGLGRELRLGDEQLVLEPADLVADLAALLREERGREPEARPQLVERAVGAYAQRVLVYARTAGETGRSMIARAGIETRDTLASGRPASSSSGELRPWTGQNEMWSTSLCFASCRHSRQINPLRSLQAMLIGSILQPNPFFGS